MTVLLDTAPGLSTRRASCAFAMATRCGADCCPQGKEPVLPGCGPLTWAMGGSWPFDLSRSDVYIS